jgi:sphingomyelin phosphodiesterase
MLTTKGYYSTILPKFNNLKIININTQAGNNENWFLIRNPTDPG